jgi:hypothetical protein
MFQCAGDVALLLSVIALRKVKCEKQKLSYGRNIVLALPRHGAAVHDMRVSETDMQHCPPSHHLHTITLN